MSDDGKEVPNGGFSPQPTKRLRSSSSTNTATSSGSIITPEEIREEFSHHDSDVARVNNGSFGCCPRTLIEALSRYQLLWLSQPDAFYFNRLNPLLLRSRSLVRDLIGANHVDEVSLVDNATTAAAIVLQRVQCAFHDGLYRRGDAVVILHHAYGSIKSSVYAYASRAGAYVIEVPLPFPVSSPSEIVSEFRRALAEATAGRTRRVRLAVIDHITSMPSVVIPVRDLVRICREEGVDQVFVDAAHAIGNVEVDVGDIGADFYASNLHKWFFCPPSVAFLHCRSSGVSSELHHPVVSTGYGKGLPVESSWIGTRDYSAQLVVPEAAAFVGRFEGGIEGVRKRNHEKAVEMGRMLAEAWGTHLGAPPEMCCSMAMVGLPACLGIGSEEDAFVLRNHLRDGFKVEVPIYFKAPPTPSPEGEGEVKTSDANGVVAASSEGDRPITGYARISHQVYNVVEDYYTLRDAVNSLVKDGFTCRKLGSD